MKNLSFMRLATFLMAVIIGFAVPLFAKDAKHVFTSDTLKATMAKVGSLYKAGKADEASSICLRLMRDYPRNRDIVQQWIIINMKRSPTGEQEMLETLKQMEVQYPENTGIIFFKAFLASEQGLNREALVDLDKLIKLEPDSALNYIGKGQALYALENYKDAYCAFDKATSLDPKRADVWGMKAVAAARMKKFNKALTAIDKGLKLDPGSPNTIYNRACIYCMKGDKTKALADLKHAIEMNPDFKNYAPTDKDFEVLWKDKDFIALTK